MGDFAENLKQLKELFPETDEEIVESTLRACAGYLDPAIEKLLELTDPNYKADERSSQELHRIQQYNEDERLAMQIARREHRRQTNVVAGNGQRWRPSNATGTAAASPSPAGGSSPVDDSEKSKKSRLKTIFRFGHKKSPSSNNLNVAPTASDQHGERAAVPSSNQQDGQPQQQQQQQQQQQPGTSGQPARPSASVSTPGTLVQSGSYNPRQDELRGESPSPIHSNEYSRPAVPQTAAMATTSSNPSWTLHAPMPVPAANPNSFATIGSDSRTNSNSHSNSNSSMGQKTRNPDLFGMDDPSSLSNYKPLEPVRTPPRVEKLAERKLGDIVSTTTHHRADSPSAAHDPFQAAEISALSIQDPDTAGAQTQPKPTISRPASPTNPFATTHSLAETNPFKHLIESQHRHQHQEQ